MAQPPPLTLGRFEPKGASKFGDNASSSRSGLDYAFKDHCTTFTAAALANSASGCLSLVMSMVMHRMAFGRPSNHD